MRLEVACSNYESIMAQAIGSIAGKLEQSSLFCFVAVTKVTKQRH